MKLRATINIEFEAADYAGAADFQRSMRELLAKVQADYQSAGLELKECRKRLLSPPAPRLAAAGGNVRSLYGTGKLHVYEDL